MEQALTLEYLYSLITKLQQENIELKQKVKELVEQEIELNLNENEDFVKLKKRMNKIDGVDNEPEPSTTEEFWDAITKKHNIRKTQFTESKIGKFFKSKKQLGNLLKLGKMDNNYVNLLGDRPFMDKSPEWEEAKKKLEVSNSKKKSGRKSSSSPPLETYSLEGFNPKKVQVEVVEEKPYVPEIPVIPIYKQFVDEIENVKFTPLLEISSTSTKTLETRRQNRKIVEENYEKVKVVLDNFKPAFLNIVNYNNNYDALKYHNLEPISLKIIQDKIKMKFKFQNDILIKYVETCLKEINEGDYDDNMKFALYLIRSIYHKDFTIFEKIKTEVKRVVKIVKPRNILEDRDEVLFSTSLN